MNRRRIRRSGWFLWILAYAVVVAAPVLAMLVGPQPEARPFLRDFSVALAFCAMSIIGLQFILTARIPSLKRPFGSDAVYFFHHRVSVVAVAAVILHVLSLGLDDRETWQLLSFWSAPLRARFAVAGLVCLLALVLVSVLRKRLRVEYITWRITHGLLAMGAAAFAMTHMQLVGAYLSLPWKRVLWAVYAASWVGALAYARVIRPIAMKLRPYEIAEVRPERGNAWTLRLRPKGHRGARFIPGQFAWITIERSPFADLEHPFSYSGSAEDPSAPRFTIKGIGDFTRRIGQLKEGTRVYVDGPFGAFSIDRRPEAESFLFVAGGIGITPIMSTLRTMRDRNDQRPCAVLYAARTLAEMTFREELEELGRQPNVQCHLIPTAPEEGWSGPSGRVGPEILGSVLPGICVDGSCEVYICGPPPMMDSVEQSLVRLGVPLRRIHTERFNLA